MEWFSQATQSEILSLLMAIVAIVGVFAFAAVKAHHRHQERIDKLKQDFNPDK